MSNPSLLCVPYRFKTSKLYSQIPDSGLGDFTVTRTTTPTAGQATRVNAAGFIETVADNVPRLDYPLGGITAGCPALLVEPSAQNLLTRSQQLDHGDWARGSGVNVTGNVSGIIAPDGSQTASLITATTQSLTIGLNQNGKTVPTGSPNTKSVYLRGVVGGESVGLRDPNQTIGTTTCVLTTSWQRFTLTETQTGGVGGLWITNIPSGGIYAWGAQLEAGSIATSYIPTAASPVTRGAETYTATIGPFNSGSAYIAISDNDTGIPAPGVHLNGPLDVVGAASLGLYLSRTSNAAFRNRLWTQAAGNVFDTTVSDLRLAFTWNGSNVNVFQNGTKVVTNFAYALTGVNIFRFGPVEARNRITAFAVYNSVLTDAQLQSLTQ